MAVLFKLDRMSPEKRETITSRFDKYSKDLSWILVNIELLKEKFPNMYVAVKERSVEDSDEDLKKLIGRMEKKGKNIEDYTLEFIQTGETKYLF